MMIYSKALETRGPYPSLAAPFFSFLHLDGDIFTFVGRTEVKRRSLIRATLGNESSRYEMSRIPRGESFDYPRRSSLCESFSCFFQKS